jgi:hypothetical protein
MIDPDQRDCALATYERLMEKTEPYCFHSPEFIDMATGVTIKAGWWSSELAVKDMEELEWKN